MKNYILAASLLILTGCFAPKEHIIYKEVKVPIVKVLAPPVVNKPELAITTLTPEQKDDLGELAKAYKITIMQLEQYVTILEDILAKQKELADKENIVTP